ncbi:MAG TPA: hypothetical protein VFW25_11715, partial [Silvibacterium sp.]|nr:hypothetical protein [Silvibacterium sp.]
TPAIAQRGIVDDWTNHHVKFMNPGSEMDAVMSGHRQQWQNYVNNPRYRAQQIRHSAAWANRFAAVESAFSTSHNLRPATKFKNSSIKQDWAASIAPSSPNGLGTAQDVFPAEFGANFDVASCADFVVFPVNTAGASGTGNGQANLVGFNNLYTTTCNSGAPSVKFAYFIGNGTVQTSPVLSEDGTKVAFVESVAGGSNFHVLTLGTTGNNGSDFASPAVPHTIVDNGNTVTSAGSNDATDTFVTMNGSPFVTRSAPFVDFTNDVAYVGDDNGVLHKFTGVFQGTLAEVTTGGWPFTVTIGTATTLTSPVLDSGDFGNTGSAHIFVADNNGLLYCIVSGTTPAFCSNPSVSVADLGSGTPGAVFAAPIVVSSADGSTPGWVFEEAVNTLQAQTQRTDGKSGNDSSTTTVTSEAVLMQADTNLGNPRRANMGTVSANQTATNKGSFPPFPTVTVNLPNLLSGDFDNIYYSGDFSGHMYFAGVRNSTNNEASTFDAQPELWRVTFFTATGGGNTAGELNTATATAIFRLASNNTNSQRSTSTPLTEFDNGTTDFLFAGVSSAGAPANCGGFGCVMNFILPGDGTAPTAANAAFSLGANGSGSSGMIIDGDSTVPGASQVYFGNLVNGTAVQVSQSSLQ